MSAPLRVGSLFTGYGGLDAAPLHLLGEESRVVWHSEISPAACTLLDYRDPGVPNLGDLTVIDPAKIEPVDALTFGWPCQPHSAAGKRLGSEDPRALWPHVHRLIAGLRPRYLFGENVARVASNGELRRVARSLAAIGYVGSWHCLRASAVGAPHRRDRLFLFAVRADAAGTVADTFGQQLRIEPGRCGGPGGEGAGVAGDDGPQRASDLTLLPTPEASDGSGGRVASEYGGVRASGAKRAITLSTAVAHHLTEPTLFKTPTAQLGVNGGSQHPDKRKAGGHGPTLADEVEWLLPTPTVRDGRRGKGWGDQAGRPLSETIHRVIEPGPDRWGQYGGAIHRWEQVLGRPAPEPTQASPRGSRVLSPAFVEWMMGLPAGWVTEVPGLTRGQQLALLGNGVVPQQAVAAFTELTARMFHVEHVAV